MEGEDGGAVFECGEDSDDEGERADAAAGQGDVDGVEMAQPAREDKKGPVENEDELKALRNNCKHSVHVAACIMCKDQMQV